MLRRIQENRLVMQCGLLAVIFRNKNNLQKSLSNKLISRYIGKLTQE